MTPRKMCSFNMLTLTARYQHQIYRCNDASADRINQGKLLPSPKPCRFPHSVYSKAEGKKQRHLHLEVFPPPSGLESKLSKIMNMSDF